jgi:hypothetical protein
MRAYNINFKNFLLYYNGDEQTPVLKGDVLTLDGKEYTAAQVFRHSEFVKVEKVKPPRPPREPRPMRPREEIRSQPVVLKVTAAELEIFNNKAKKHGISRTELTIRAVKAYEGEKGGEVRC